MIILTDLREAFKAILSIGEDNSYVTPIKQSYGYGRQGNHFSVTSVPYSKKPSYYASRQGKRWN